MNRDARLVAMEVRAAGHVEVDGETLEFQDVRVYVRMPARTGACTAKGKCFHGKKKP
jgi:hypothetical protein